MGEKMSRSNNGTVVQKEEFLQLVVNRMEKDLQTNSASFRNRLSDTINGETHYGKRKMYDVFGYLATDTIIGNEEAALAFYNRRIDGTAIDKYANATWKNRPIVHDGEDNDTQFAVDANQMLKLNWSLFNRLDKLNQIGRYSIIVFGLPDVKSFDDLSKPAKGVYKSLVNVRIYSDYNITQIELDNKPESPRMGLPEFYTVSIGANVYGSEVSNLEVITTRIHWSRCIHVVENNLISETEGMPRWLRGLNISQSLELVLGSGGENTWNSASRRVVIELKDEYSLDPDAVTALNEKVEEWYNDTISAFYAEGAKINQWQGRDPSILGVFEPLAQMYSALVGMPKTILFGNQQSRIASDKDEQTWAGVISARQLSWAEPVIVRPFIDRLVKWNLLPTPSNGEYNMGTKNPAGEYSWPSIIVQTELEQADIRQKQAGALAKAQSARNDNNAPITMTEVRNYGGLPSEPEDDIDRDLLMREDLFGEEE